MSVNKLPSVLDLVSDLRKEYDTILKEPLYVSGSYGDDIRELQYLIGKIVDILEQDNN